MTVKCLAIISTCAAWSLSAGGRSKERKRGQCHSTLTTDMEVRKNQATGNLLVFQGTDNGFYHPFRALTTMQY